MLPDPLCVHAYWSLGHETRNIPGYVVRTLLVGKRVTIDSLQTLLQVFSAMYIVLRNEEGSGSWKDMSKECMLRKSA